MILKLDLLKSGAIWRQISRFIYHIIFIGNGELSVADFAQYVERHKICSEYMAQSEAYLSGMRERIDLIRKEETQTNGLKTKK